MSRDSLYSAAVEAFADTYCNADANKALAIELHNSYADGTIVTNPKKFEAFMSGDATQGYLVAVPLDMYHELIKIRDEFSAIKDVEGRNIHSLERNREDLWLTQLP
jgi:hypothetical protein